MFYGGTSRILHSILYTPVEKRSNNQVSAMACWWGLTRLKQLTMVARDICPGIRFCACVRWRPRLGIGVACTCLGAFSLFLPKKSAVLFWMSSNLEFCRPDCLGSETDLFPLLLAKTNRSYELLSVPDKCQPLDLAHSLVESEKLNFSKKYLNCKHQPSKQKL